IGIHKKISKNNINSIFLLIAFPLILFAMVYLFLFFTTPQEPGYPSVNETFVSTIPVILIATGIWFLIAWLFHSSMIRMATGSRPLERKENKRVYNLVENLCISQGMKIPKIFVIEDDSLNAFASGINEKSYAISLSRGIINKLNDEELEGVIAHELTHIGNRDVRLLIISVIFVGIFAFVAEMAFRSLHFTGRSRDGKSNAPIILLAIVITSIAYLISILLRFGISRSREYLADAGAAELTRNPRALASALRKISDDPWIEAVQNRDVAQMFIDNPRPSVHGFSWDNLFSTHPPIEKRIGLLEQFT
ncbi:MAG: M48 family metallopeptidase, partial [Prolixibacteraceae bacterium]|nr:M48 family metallopeptidase [Prolixibacteraceae bacterium]